MARKPLKLTKNALMLIGMIVLVLVVLIVLNFGKANNEIVKPVEEDKETLSSLVVENQVLKVELLEFVSAKNFDDSYQEVAMDIAAKE